MGYFSARERRGVLLLLPLLLLVVVGVVVVDLRRAQQRVDTLQHEELTLQSDSLTLFEFDPNTISFDSLQLLGFSKSQALQLLKYREAGKIYRLPEDLALIYGMTDSLFARIRPYVCIGEAYRFQPRHFEEREFPAPPARQFHPQGPFRIDTVSPAFLRAMGFSVRWSEAFVDCYRRREMRSLEELRELNFIGDSITRLLAPYIQFPPCEADPFDAPVDINRADSMALLRVYGIGEKTAGRIVRYRERLGGFYTVEQISEVKGVTEANYEKILEQICCENFHIQKIDINFAPAERLREHPYIDPRTLRRLISKRQQLKSKGGWSTVEEMILDDIFTEEQARRLAPYLHFGTHPQE